MSSFDEKLRTEFLFGCSCTCTPLYLHKKASRRTEQTYRTILMTILTECDSKTHLVLDVDRAAF